MLIGFCNNFFNFLFTVMLRGEARKDGLTQHDYELIPRVVNDDAFGDEIVGESEEENKENTNVHYEKVKEKKQLKNKKYESHRSKGRGTKRRRYVNSPNDATIASSLFFNFLVR